MSARAESSIATTSETTATVYPGRLAFSADLIDRSVPFVLLRNHYPFWRTQWDWASVPLSSARSDKPHRVRVRGLRFDLCIETAKFLSLICELDPSAGIDLFQTTRVPPDTLFTNEMAKLTLSTSEFVTLRYLLPHEGEVGVVSAATGDILSAALARLRSAWKFE